MSRSLFGVTGKHPGWQTRTTAKLDHQIASIQPRICPENTRVGEWSRDPASSGLFRFYRKEIQHAPQLTREGEVELLRRVVRGKREAIDLMRDSYSLIPSARWINKTEVMLIPIRELPSSADLRGIVDTLKLAATRRENWCSIGQSTKLISLCHRLCSCTVRVENAIADLVRSNQRLVIALVRLHLKRGLPFLDLVQEGNLGLMKAIEKFDYRYGHKLSTYASWWIRQSMADALKRQSRMIRIPVNRVEQWTKIVQMEDHLLQKLGRKPSPREIAEQLDLSVESVRTAKLQYHQPISLDTPIGHDQNCRIGDLIGDRKVISPDESVTASLMSEHAAGFMKTLVPREEYLLRKRFGIGANNEHTLAEIGRKLNLTRERVRQIETSALRKLRRSMRYKQLDR